MTRRNLNRSESVRWRKLCLAVYLIVVLAIAVSYFFFEDESEYIIRTILDYRELLTFCFAIFSFTLVPFQIMTVQKHVPRKRDRFGLLVPVIDLALKPSLDISLFYASLFILDTVFEQSAQGLTTDSVLVLVVVAFILLFQSILDVCVMSREVFQTKESST